MDEELLIQKVVKEVQQRMESKLDDKLNDFQTVVTKQLNSLANTLSNNMNNLLEEFRLESMANNSQVLKALEESKKDSTSTKEKESKEEDGEEDFWVEVTKKKNQNRLSGSFNIDSKLDRRQSDTFEEQIPKATEEDSIVVDELSFIQKLNYKFIFAKQRQDRAITYVQAEALTDTHKDLQPYMFKNSGLLHVATRLVKIIVYLLERSSSLGKVQATDFVEYSLLKAVINQYKNMYPKAKELEQSAIIALFNYSGEDNPNGYLKINKGFGCLVHCIILLIPHGFDVNDIMISGMNQVTFWSKALQGQVYRKLDTIEFLDVYTRIYQMLYMFSTILYPSKTSWLSQTGIISQFLQGISENAPVGRSKDGTMELHIVALAKVASTKYSSLEALSDCLTKSIHSDSSSASSVLLATKQLRYHFTNSRSYDKHSSPTTKHNNIALAMLDAYDGDEGSEEGYVNAVDDSVSNSNNSGADTEYSASDADDTNSDGDVEHEGVYALPRSYATADKLAYYKTQPCFRYFRFKIHHEKDGCTTTGGQPCKFSHDDNNAEMVKKYHDKRPQFLRMEEENRLKARGKHSSSRFPRHKDREGHRKRA